LLTCALQQEAQAISENDQKMVHSDGSGGKQLGLGVYISPGFKEWEVDEEQEPYDCAVLVGRDDWPGVRKAWVPQRYRLANKQTCSILWGTSPPVYREYTCNYNSQKF
jgi:hypothetical protein